MSSKKKAALGKGLSAILESPETDITSKDISGNYVVGAVASVKIGNIETNPFQPRDKVDEEALQELAESIKEQGIIQPLTIRKMGYEQYQLISGERRLKAAKLAGMEEIPAYIRVANDEQMLEMALVENIQREDLNAMEIAISYNRLMEEVNLTQEKLAQRLGKSRTTIANFLRLLKLPAEIQSAVQENKLTMGQARPLINIEDDEQQKLLLDEILENNLSARKIEQRVREINEGSKIARKKAEEKKQKQEIPQRYVEIKENLREKLDTNIKLSRNNKGKGNIVISFNSDEDLERILSLIDKKANSE
ncbi:MAG: ParB/RepB/Spo0J family partition protein [Bacteroidales bacterium]|nr:ParB/RepB/Spo0J family partition protein [Bacteroidales bacterium]MCF8333429.1 ParB/RepB/Spo0J family partition protein [Bacteroidales bacterium]